MEKYPAADTQTGNLWSVPQLLLLAVHESDQRMRSLGRITLASGAPVDAVTTTASGNQVTIGLDPDTHVVRASIGVRSDFDGAPIAGETEFRSYRRLNGVLMPEQRIAWAGGEITQETTYTNVVPNYRAPDAVATPPASYQQSTVPSVAPVRELAKGVWLVGGDTSSLMVDMGDHLVIIDAAPFVAPQLSKHAAALAPGKPIRFVVPTHHHDDHAPGLRILAEASVVTTPGNRKMFERLTRNPIEVVKGSKTLVSPSRTLELHDIGPSPHAAEILVAWLPAEGILFQADLLDIGGDGIVWEGINNETTTHYAAWIARKGWNVRTHAGAHGAAIDAEVFRKILAQPVKPQGQLSASQAR